jgi:exonuclease III
MKPRNQEIDSRQTGYGKGQRDRKRRGRNDVILATWNVRTLGKLGALRAVKEQLSKYNIDIAAIQETKWAGKGIFGLGEHILLYSGGQQKYGGTGFIVKKQLKKDILNFHPIDERMCYIRKKAKFFRVTLFNVYAPTEERTDKDAFYSKLEEEYNKIPKHDVKIVMGDMNAKIGKEKQYRQTIGKESLHRESNDNGQRLIDFAISRNMVVKSMWNQRKDIHKMTWRSPDGSTCNEIDHVIIEARHVSDIMEVKTCRGADGDTDHFIIKIRYRQRIERYREGRRMQQERYDTRKLQDSEIQKTYQEKFKEKLGEAPERWVNGEVEDKWEILKKSVIEAASESGEGKKGGEEERLV